MTAKPVAEEDDGRKSDLSRNGRHLSALDDNKAKSPTEIQPPRPVEEKKESSSHQLLPKDEKKPEAAAVPSEKKETPKAAAPKTEAKPEAKPEPPAPKAEPIDHLKVDEATEPAVQDAVKMLNDIITVINADGSASKYSNAITSAKEQLSKLIANISTLKAVASQAAESREKALHAEFDGLARALLQQQAEAIRDQELRWKEEYEAERTKLADAYEHKLAAELAALAAVHVQRERNALLEQAIALNRQFAGAVQGRVEAERAGRLAHLARLSDEVRELEDLTARWNDVVERNVRTQRLGIAVEALRAALEGADRPRPFVAELAALKEVAAGDPVVDAAVASINPVSYQRGVPSAAQLVDRFRRVAAEVRKVELLPADAGVLSHAASAILSRLMFRKGTGDGIPVGDDVESVLARTEAMLEEGQLDEAAREINALQGWPKVLCKDWLGDVRRVLEVKMALDVSALYRFCCWRDDTSRMNSHANWLQVIATEARLQSLLAD